MSIEWCIVLPSMAGGAAAALKQSLGEEIAVAEWIDQHLAPTTQRYLELSRSGVKAGV